MQLSAYENFVQKASGVQTTDYSVTLPPYETGDPTVDNRAAVPDARLLGLLNVRYIVSAYPLTADGLFLRWTSQNQFVYANQYDLPRAWVQVRDKPFVSDATRVSALLVTPNRITLNAQGPGLLVLSEIAYPGWQVTVDGEPARIETVAGVLRGVRLTAGPHSVSFRFHPLTVYIGAAISLAAVTAFLLALLLSRRANG